MSDFRLADLGRVYWPSTAKLAAARGLAAGLVLALLGLIMSPPAEDMLVLPLFPLVLTAISLPLALALRLGAFATSFIPMIGGFIGLTCLFFGALVTTIGDPLVYLANRKFPALLDVADLKFLNFNSLILIMQPE